MTLVAALGHGPSCTRSRLVWTCLYMMLAAGTVGALVVWALGGVLIDLVASVAFRAELHAALLPMAVLVPLSLVGLLLTGLLEARERFLSANVFQAGFASLGHAVPLAAAFAGHSTLPAVLWCLCAVRAVAIVTHTGFLMFHRELRAPTKPDLTAARSLLGFGAWVSVTNVLAPILSTLDQMLVGALLGAKAAAHYSIPARLIGPLQIVAISMAKTVFPQLSRSSEQDGRLLAQQTYGLLIAIMTLLCAPAIVVAKPFLTAWLGPQYAAHAALPAQILFVGAWANALAFVAVSLLQSQRRPQAIARLHAIQLVPFVAAVAVLVPTLGLAGAALAWTGRVIFDFVALYRVAGLEIDARRQLSFCAVSMAVALILAAFAGVDGLAALVIAPLLFLVTAIAILVQLPELRVQVGKMVRFARA
jgi:O-antigen/teichoic acid export membrane protein